LQVCVLYDFDAVISSLKTSALTCNSGAKVWIRWGWHWPSSRHTVEHNIFGEPLIGWQQFASASASNLQLNKSRTIICR
jgi:hypothetical protein